MTRSPFYSLLIALGCLLMLSACSGTRKTLLFENRVYHWDVYFVRKNHFSVGNYQHFEVYYKGRQLVLPKTITDNQRDIKEFVTAAAIDNRDSRFGTVIVTFQGDFVKEDGTLYRAFKTLHIRPGKANELWVTNPCDGSEKVMQLAKE